MSHTNLTLGPHWGDEWPDHVDVSHEGRHDSKRYVPERVCRMGFGKLHYEWVCLACGKHYHWHEIRHARYCPDCGAKIENEGWGDAD